MIASETLVSLVIPVFNCEPGILARSISSAINQTHENLEIILVDDGSREQFAVEIDRAARVDRRIKLVRQDNEGVSSARNAGLKVATGSFVAFLDADDHLASGFIGSALEFAQRESLGVVFGGMELMSCFGSVQWRSGQSAQTQRVILQGGDLVPVRGRIFSSSPSPRSNAELTLCTNVVGALYAAEIIDGCQFPVGVTQAEDRVFNFDVLRRVKRIGFTSELWYTYDLRGTNGATRQLDPSKATELSATVDAIAAAARLGEKAGPAEPRQVRRSAAIGVLNYLKLATLVLAQGRVTLERLSALRSMFGRPSVVAALKELSGLGLRDKAFAWCVRRQSPVPAVILARLRLGTRGE